MRLMMKEMSSDDEETCAVVANEHDECECYVWFSFFDIYLYAKRWAW